MDFTFGNPKWHTKMTSHFPSASSASPALGPSFSTRISRRVGSTLRQFPGKVVAKFTYSNHTDHTSACVLARHLLLSNKKSYTCRLQSMHSKFPIYRISLSLGHHLQSRNPWNWLLEMPHGYTLHLLQGAASNKPPPGLWLWVWASNRIHIAPRATMAANKRVGNSEAIHSTRDFEPNLNLKSHQTLHRVRLTRRQNYVFFHSFSVASPSIIFL